MDRIVRIVAIVESFGTTLFNRVTLRVSWLGKPQITASDARRWCILAIPIRVVVAAFVHFEIAILVDAVTDFHRSRMDVRIIVIAIYFW